jgi:excisionase family DNA binding protein
MGAAMAQTMAGMSGTAGEQQAAAASRDAIPEIMTLSEAAAYMRVGEEDVLEVIQADELKAKKIGTSYRISKRAIDDFLAS